MSPRRRRSPTFGAHKQSESMAALRVDHAITAVQDARFCAGRAGNSRKRVSPRAAEVL